MISERERHAANGLVAFPVLFLTMIAVFWLFFQAVLTREALPIVGSIFLIALQTVAWFGFFSVAPNEGRVLQLFGSYRGTVRDPGLRYANPFYSKRKISLRVRNFESSNLKVNDHVGNPIEIAAIVVWRVVDTAEALFLVDDYKQFVKMQTEAALRNLASGYAYDTFDDGTESLRSHPTETNAQLRTEVQNRLEKAGVEVIEARISHLAYAPEIAGAMLQRQQASAIIAARTKIVDGAVGMVEMALSELSKKNVIELDQDRKAAMVSNLLVVLCGDRAGVQPVLNAGTIYH